MTSGTGYDSSTVDIDVAVECACVDRRIWCSTVRVDLDSGHRCSGGASDCTWWVWIANELCVVWFKTGHLRSEAKWIELSRKLVWFREKSRAEHVHLRKSHESMRRNCLLKSRSFPCEVVFYKQAVAGSDLDLLYTTLALSGHRELFPLQSVRSEMTLWLGLWVLRSWFAGQTDWKSWNSELFAHCKTSFCSYQPVIVYWFFRAWRMKRNVRHKNNTIDEQDEGRFVTIWDGGSSRWGVFACPEEYVRRQAESHVFICLDLDFLTSRSLILWQSLALRDVVMVVQLPSSSYFTRNTATELSCVLRSS